MTACFLQMVARVAANAEMRKTQSGKTIFSFLAVADVRKGESLWVNVSIWAGDRKDSLVPYIKKGAILFLAGVPNISLSTYQDQTRVRISMTPDTIKIIQFPPRENQEQPTNHQENPPTMQQQSFLENEEPNYEYARSYGQESTKSSNQDWEDDVPF